jgi:hypothetical protein
MVTEGGGTASGQNRQRTWGGRSPSPRVSGAKRGMRGVLRPSCRATPTSSDRNGVTANTTATRAAWLRRRSVNAARRKTFPAEGKFEEKLSRPITEERSDLMSCLMR